MIDNSTFKQNISNDKSYSKRSTNSFFKNIFDQTSENLSNTNNKQNYNIFNNSPLLCFEENKLTNKKILNINENNKSKELDLNNKNILSKVLSLNNENLFNFKFTNEKAGMTNLDKDYINQTIIDATKNSSIYLKEKARKEKIKDIVLKEKIKLETFNADQQLKDRLNKQKDIKINKIKKTRNLDKIWLHLDMDMFYAAVEIRDNPLLANKPVAVGDEKMISTSNYIARKYGVRSAMPGFIAKKLCPDLVFVNINMNKYIEASNIIMKILKEYDSNMQSISLDEAFLDISNYCYNANIKLKSDCQDIITNIYNTDLNYLSLNTINNKKPDFVDKLEKDIIQKIKNDIYIKTKLTASIGIASNKMLSKICSDKNKPNGYFILEANESTEMKFMKDLKIRKIPSIGEVSEIKYNMHDIITCNDVINKSLDLFYLLNEENFEFIYKAAIGIGSAFHSKEDINVQKSISLSKTFKLTNNLDVISYIFHDVIKRLFDNIVEEKIIAKCIHLDVIDKFENHNTISLTVKNYIETEDDILKEAWRLMNRIMKDKPDGIKLLRVGLSKLKLLEDGEIRGKLKDKNVKTMMFNFKKDDVNTKNVKSTSLSTNIEDNKYYDNEYEAQKKRIKDCLELKRNKYKSKKGLINNNYKITTKNNLLELENNKTIKNKNNLDNLIDNMKLFSNSESSNKDNRKYNNAFKEACNLEKSEKDNNSNNEIIINNVSNLIKETKRINSKNNIVNKNNLNKEKNNYYKKRKLANRITNIEDLFSDKIVKNAEIKANALNLKQEEYYK